LDIQIPDPGIALTDEEEDEEGDGEEVGESTDRVDFSGNGNISPLQVIDEERQRMKMRLDGRIPTRPPPALMVNGDPHG
jgi:hypothetical protein